VKHFTLPRFWQHYRQLPKEVQETADKSYELLKADPRHPSLHFKQIGGAKKLWSVRVGKHYRALGSEKPQGIVWFWIGPHAEYDKLLAYS
jgi:mRNA-degrading endonuclease RelE of RelBE toxin-antitoxin system